LSRHAHNLKRRNQCDRQGGFSLIELLLGTVAVIVCLGAVIMATLQIGRVRMVDEELNLAYMACMNSLEDLRSVPFADLPALDGVGFDVPALNGAPNGLAAVPGDPDGLPGQFIITVEDTGGGTTLYSVTAEVQWVGHSGSNEFKLATLIGERNYR
jgi:type II secretory pathway pseudopilin PulG